MKNAVIGGFLITTFVVFLFLLSGLIVNAQTLEDLKTEVPKLRDYNETELFLQTDLSNIIKTETLPDIKCEDVKVPSSCDYFGDLVHYDYIGEPVQNTNITAPNTIKLSNGDYIVYPQDIYILKDAIWHEIKKGQMPIELYNNLVAKHNILHFWKTPIAMAQSYEPSDDAEIYNANPTWNIAHDAVSGSIRSYFSQSIIGVGLSGGSYYVSRYFSTIDLSSVEGTVTDAKYYIYVESKTDQNGDLGVFGKPTHSNPIVAGDFDLYGTTTYSNLIDEGDFTTNAYNYFTLNSSATTSINEAIASSSSFKMTIQEYDNDILDVSRGVYGEVRFTDVSTTTSSRRPYLYLTIASTTEETITDDLPSDLPEVNDISVITGKIENDDGTYSYVYYRIPFIIWLVLYLIVFWIAERIILELIIRWRK